MAGRIAVVAACAATGVAASLLTRRWGRLAGQADKGGASPAAGAAARGAAPSQPRTPRSPAGEVDARAGGATPPEEAPWADEGAPKGVWPEESRYEELLRARVADLEQKLAVACRDPDAQHASGRADSATGSEEGDEEASFDDEVSSGDGEEVDVDEAIERSRAGQDGGMGAGAQQIFREFAGLGESGEAAALRYLRRLGPGGSDSDTDADGEGEEDERQLAEKASELLRLLGLDRAHTGQADPEQPVAAPAPVRDPERWEPAAGLEHYTLGYAEKVRFLQPAGGVWALVAGPSCRLEVVADETTGEPETADEVARGGDEAGVTVSLRLVLTDQRSGAVVLNEYLVPTCPYRCTESPTFHAYTDHQGFERGFEFGSAADAQRVHLALTDGRGRLRAAAGLVHAPALCRAWRLGGKADAQGAPAVAGARCFDGPASGNLRSQQVVFSDMVRTQAYRQAIEHNHADFVDQVVVELGAGAACGLLAIFAAWAGARRVFAVEPDAAAAECCRALVASNGLGGVVEVVHGCVADIELPEPADVLLCEPMGALLFDGGGVEAFLHARDKWLRPGGRLFPSHGTLYAAPLVDPEMHAEQRAHADFWRAPDGMYGVDVSSMQALASEAHFACAIRDTVLPEHVLQVAAHPPRADAAGAEYEDEEGPDPEPEVSSMAARFDVDFTTARPEELATIRLELDLPAVALAPDLAELHGFAAWFDVSFDGGSATTVLSTAPGQPPTRWHQTALLLPLPVAVPLDADGLRAEVFALRGALTMRRTARPSYDVELALVVAPVAPGCPPLLRDGAAAGGADSAAPPVANVVHLHDTVFRHLWSERLSEFEAYDG
jgi:hypothetical protein